MAKSEFDKTPLEVAKVSTERLTNEAPWALAIAQYGVTMHLGDNFKKNKPKEFENLSNWIAQQLVVAKGEVKSLPPYDYHEQQSFADYVPPT